MTNSILKLNSVSHFNYTTIPRHCSKLNIKNLNIPSQYEFKLFPRCQDYCAQLVTCMPKTHFYYTRTHAHTHARMHARMHTHIHARTHARTHTRTHARTHSLTHARTHARTHTHTHTHTHTYKVVLVYYREVQSGQRDCGSGSTGAIIGAVFGALFGVLVVVIGVCLCKRYC